ncbi:MAG: hypothetical protein Tp138OMZ00d2C19078261_13 [Prokaryotic dsDNA virus sp.]|jgi:hypothetical protein|nr:MAG: hypothetical protein Tp138OMZ00d2C19078261_13 [Prokaryotic dsDNA virus sp.]|tara:strand:- start:14955 stop:15512 length:558 start_codon:yes stop_codon:yes gene_type:complete
MSDGPIQPVLFYNPPGVYPPAPVFVKNKFGDDRPILVIGNTKLETKVFEEHGFTSMSAQEMRKREPMKSQFNVCTKAAFRTRGDVDIVVMEPTMISSMTTKISKNIRRCPGQKVCLFTNLEPKKAFCVLHNLGVVKDIWPSYAAFCSHFVCMNMPNGVVIPKSVRDGEVENLNRLLKPYVEMLHG